MSCQNEFNFVTKEPIILTLWIITQWVGPIINHIGSRDKDYRREFKNAIAKSIHQTPHVSMRTSLDHVRKESCTRKYHPSRLA